MATDNRMIFATLAFAGAALFAGAVAGCQNERATGASHAARHGETFQADNETRPVDRFITVQSAAAARNDGTLTADHFDGRGGLNSLGRRKLDLMLKADGAAPLVVYLDLSRDSAAARARGDTPAAFETHRDAVRVYLADRGLSDQQVDVRSGTNLGNTHPARDGLRGLAALDDNSQSVTDAASSPAPAGGGKTAADLMSNAAGR